MFRMELDQTRGRCREDIIVLMLPYCKDIANKTGLGTPVQLNS
jgi:hypothetical protein